jgi:hypothetical protein
MWRSVLGCVLTIIAPIASAQVFECTNAAGVKEYAHFCPPGTVQQRQITKGAESGGDARTATPGAGAAPKSAPVQDAEYRQRLLERQNAEKKAEQEQARAEEFERNCEEARAGLQAVQGGQRLQRFDPATGERLNYTDEELAEAAERQRKAISQWCK